MEAGAIVDRGWRSLTIMLVSVGLGLMALLVALASPELSRRTMLGGVLGAGLVAAVLVTKRAREVLLFGWVVSLTYNRQFFVFIPLVGDQGSQGPYVIASDLFLVALLGLWLYEFA